MEPSTHFVPHIIPVCAGIELRPVIVANAPALYRLIDRNRAGLMEWLAWATADYCETDLAKFLADREEENACRTALTLAIWADDAICGSIAMHQIDQIRKTTSVGYWLDSQQRGRGVVTDACRALVTEAFTGYGIHRVEIRCAVGNDRSAAIPLRLGFREEGVLREAELLHGKFVDLRLFGMLSHHWEGRYGRV